MLIPVMEQLALFDDGYRVHEWVYYGARGGQVKIGTTRRQPEQRARELGLTLLRVEPGGRTRERELHKRFKKSRIDREWFLPSPDLLAWVAGRAA